MKILGEIVKDVALVSTGALIGILGIGLLAVYLETEVPESISRIIKDAGDYCRID